MAPKTRGQKQKAEAVATKTAAKTAAKTDAEILGN